MDAWAAARERCQMSLLPRPASKTAKAQRIPKRTRLISWAWWHSELRIPMCCLGTGTMNSLHKRSRLQHHVQKMAVKKYGIHYLYASLEVMQEIEKVRDSWCAELVWDYLAVPETSRRFGYSPKYYNRFSAILSDSESLRIEEAGPQNCSPILG